MSCDIKMMQGYDKIARKETPNVQFVAMKRIQKVFVCLFLVE